MRPPICDICRKRFRASAGGKIYFKLTEEQAARNARMKAEKKKGHPSGLEWYCEDHIEVAKKYRHLTSIEASTKIKEELRSLGLYPIKKKPSSSGGLKTKILSKPGNLVTPKVRNSANKKSRKPIKRKPIKRVPPKSKDYAEEE